MLVFHYQHNARSAVLADIQRKMRAEIVRQGRVDYNNVKLGFENKPPRLGYVAGKHDRGVLPAGKQRRERLVKLGRRRYRQKTVAALR